MRNALCVLAVLLATCFGASAKVTCERTVLPAAVNSVLRSTYADWKIVSLEMLNPEEQAFWKSEHSMECPGFAVGRFSGTREEIAVNLVKSSQGALYQQVLLFSTTSASLKPISIFAPMKVASISVVLRMEPGRYASSEGGKSVKVRWDSIAVAAPEKGSIQYYWNGKEFKNIITSE